MVEDPNHQDFDCCEETLAKHHFCLDSMVKASKHTYNVFKDFNTFTRKMAQGSKRVSKDYKIATSDQNYSP